MRVQRAGGPRWALSFADLALLLTGFMVLVQARPDPARLSTGLAKAFGTPRPAVFDARAVALFEPGEAILRPTARRAIRSYARGAKGAIVSSQGTEAATARFDGWELAAARTAAVAREIAAAGVPEGKVTVAIAPGTGGGQRLLVSRS